MKQLNVAIIGQGRSGRNIHGKHILKDPRFKVVAVVDALPDRRVRAMQEYGIGEKDVYATYQELFGREDIDFVVNSSFSQLHQPIAVDLMRHGFNVLQEKPIASNMDQIKELEDVIAQTGKTFAIFLQSRYQAPFMKARDIAASGILGNIVCVKCLSNRFSRRWDWQTVQGFTGGDLFNKGPHTLGHALEFLGAYDQMPEVKAYMNRANSFGDAEDFSKLLLFVPGKPLIDMEVTSCDAYPPFDFQVLGDKGGLVVKGKNVKWRYFRPEEAPEQHLITEPLKDENGLPIYCNEKLIWHEEEWTEEEADKDAPDGPTYRLYSDVYNKLVNGVDLPVSFKQVALQIAIMQEAHRQNPFPVKY